MVNDDYEHLLHTLNALLIELNALQTITRVDANNSAPDWEMVRGGLGDLEELARKALSTVRSCMEELPSTDLAGIPLPEALARMVEDAAERLGVTSRIAISGVDEQDHTRETALPPKAERLLYLVTREALFLLERREGLRRIRFSLTYGRDTVQLSLEDDGLAPATELDAPLPPIMGDLTQRFTYLGGELAIVPLPEKGRRITVRLPYALPVAEPVTLPISSQEPLQQDGGSSATPIRILIVDNQTVIRAGLRRLLESYPGLQVIGEAVDGVQAVSETVELGPQVVLMDAQLPNGQSLETLRQLKQLNLDTKVLLLATQDREEYLYETIRAGADGYILKDVAPDELVQAVRTVARGDVLVQPQLAGRLLSRFGRQGRGNNRYDTLTARELEVLHLLARGMRNKEIAARLFVSERTVNFHLANIYQKLNVSGRTEALSRALEQGLITP